MSDSVRIAVITILGGALATQISPFRRALCDFWLRFWTSKPTRPLPPSWDPADPFGEDFDRRQPPSLTVGQWLKQVWMRYLQWIRNG